MMTDSELAAYLGFKSTDDQVKVQKFIDELPPERHALYQRMHDLEGEIALWQAGLDPKPTDAILCGPKQIRHHK